MARGRGEHAAFAEALALRALPSAANLVAIDVDPDGGGAEHGQKLLEALAAGVFIRRPNVAPLDRCTRVSSETTAEHARFDPRRHRSRIIGLIT